MVRSFVCALVVVTSASFAKPPSQEEARRRSDVVKELQNKVAAETTDAARVAAISQAWADHEIVDVRHRILEVAAKFPCPALEEFLTGVVETVEDAGLRSKAVSALGRSGSEKCLPLLAKVAASDKTTSIQSGCIHGTSNARRAAIFAMADLAERFVKLGDKAATELRALKLTQDNEGLPDARLQALFQITRDRALLEPFFKQIKSSDARVREQGVVAFRFLKLNKAPPELLQALKDENLDVRLWAALVLGEIGDPDSVDPLLAIARDAKADGKLRCNAISALGHMRAKSAAEAMEKLLDDQDVAANAAIALYRITGKKTPQFPEGYNAD